MPEVVVPAGEAGVAQPQFLTPSQPRDLRGAKKGVETRPQVLKRGSSAGRIARMEPGEERDGRVVRLEDEGRLAAGWQGRKGRERTISSADDIKGMERKGRVRTGGSREDGSKRLRQGSDTGVEEEVREDWALQVEREKPETEEGVVEELRRRMTYKLKGPFPACRVRAVGAFTARDEDELSFKPGSIITVLRVSQMSPGLIVGWLDGKKGYAPTTTMACYGESCRLKGDLLKVI